MTRNEQGHLALGFALVLIAGFVDAVGLMRLGDLFVSFMSGNTTWAGLGLVDGRHARGLTALALIVLFVMGAFAARLVSHAAGAWARPALLSLVSALLLLATVAGTAVSGAGFAVFVAALVLAMGVQNSVLTRAGDAKVTPTYVTGTLVHLGHGLADALVGQGSVWRSYLLLWLGLACGAALGGFLALHEGALALILPAASAALLALWLGAGVRSRSMSERPS